MNEPSNAAILSEVTSNQHIASDPNHSAWVSANAGSGKTHVLTQRVIRLMLEGVEPSRILCLTFTKAAAAEMSNRVFAQLSGWVLMDDHTLSKALEEKGVRSISAKKLVRARQLFTRALETPGGLKIQTIHAFCTSLLQQFPLEANASGHFEIIDDITRATLLKNARDEVYGNCIGDRILASHLNAAMAYGSDKAIEDTIRQILATRSDFVGWIDGDVDERLDELARHAGVNADQTSDELAAELLSQLPIDDTALNEVAIIAGNFSETGNVAYAAKIKAYLQATASTQKFLLRLKPYRTKEGGEIKSVPGNKNLRDEIPWLEEAQHAEKQQLEIVEARWKLHQQLAGSRGLFHIASNIIELYEKAKRARGLVDYDDLVQRANDLLNRSDLREWVKYKLDSGTDHILVDEAQDTSPVQWKIILALVEEFFAGEGRKDRAGTLFVVGDLKQSIFSFQGAEPERFARVREELLERASNANYVFKDVRLPASFRSTPDVLGAVDKVFENSENSRGLVSGDDAVIHEAVRMHDRGEVQIWPMQENPKSVPKKEWNEPVDSVDSEHSTLVLARMISNQIKTWIEEETVLEGQGRPIRAGDVLVLVRKRDRFVNALTRQLKEDGVAVAGADRLKLGQHIAVRDLLSLAKWALFTDDDLSLAEVLKSPLVGLDEAQLFELAHGREKANLWQRVSSSELISGEVLALLHWALEQSRKPSAHDFFAGFLSVAKARQKFRSRLGSEVDDVLDAFILSALQHDHAGRGGLESFVHGFFGAELEIKREMDLRHDEVRIMTAHSSKGLEAPVVFLVDPGQAAFDGKHRKSLVPVRDDTASGRVNGFVWQATKLDETGLSKPGNQKAEQLAQEEYRRLLYVGMTRAEDRLIICGYSKPNGKYETWHSMVQQALGTEAEPLELGEGHIALRWKSAKGNRRDKPIKLEENTKGRQAIQLPGWAMGNARSEFLPKPPLSPSMAGEQMAAIGLEKGEFYGQGDFYAFEDGNGPANNSTTENYNGRALGTLMHLLLQYLPESERASRDELAQKIIENYRGKFDPQTLQLAVSRVHRLLDDTQFKRLFSGQTRAEVSVSGSLKIAQGNRQVSGQIDRLCIFEDRIVVVDFKSDSWVPRNPEAVSDQYLIQVAIYRELVAQIFGDLPVEGVILWTAAPVLMTLPGDLLEAKLSHWKQMAS